jgi:HTH-type transcriptional regulator/antitoxin MqsA
MSMYPKTCAQCGGGVSASSEPIGFQLRGEEIMVADISHGVCEQCGEVFLGLDDMARLQQEAVKYSKRSRGLLTPEEVRALRQSLGYSQPAFEHLLGTGPKTVTRWEKGTVFQNAVADRLMRLILLRPDVIETLRSISVGRVSENQTCCRTAPHFSEGRHPGELSTPRPKVVSGGRAD